MAFRGVDPGSLPPGRSEAVNRGIQAMQHMDADPRLGIYDPKYCSLPIPGISSGQLRSGMNYDWLPRGTPLMAATGPPPRPHVDPETGEEVTDTDLEAAISAQILHGENWREARQAEKGMEKKGFGKGAIQLNHLERPKGKGGGSDKAVEPYGVGQPVTIKGLTHAQLSPYNGFVGDIVAQDIEDFHDGHQQLHFTVRIMLHDPALWFQTLQKKTLGEIDHWNIKPSERATLAIDSNRRLGKQEFAAYQAHRHHQSKHAFVQAGQMDLPPYMLLGHLLARNLEPYTGPMKSTAAVSQAPGGRSEHLRQALDPGHFDHPDPGLGRRQGDFFLQGQPYEWQTPHPHFEGKHKGTHPSDAPYQWQTPHPHFQEPEHRGPYPHPESQNFWPNHPSSQYTSYPPSSTNPSYPAVHPAFQSIQAQMNTMYSGPPTGGPGGVYALPGYAR